MIMALRCIDVPLEVSVIEDVECRHLEARSPRRPPAPVMPSVGISRLLADLVELAGGHVEDEAAYRVLVRDERARLDPGGGLPHVLVQVGERLGRPFRLDAGLV